MSTATPLVLPEELSIYGVAELRAAWLAWLAEAQGELLVDASAVAQVDGAGLQLLLALVRSIEARALGWRLQGATPALQAACRLLGLGPALLGHAPAATPA